MDDVEGVPKSLIHWSVALLAGLFLFSLISFFLLRARERRLQRERVVFMDWDGVASLAWSVTAAALVLVAFLTYARLHGHRSWNLSDYQEAYEEGGLEHVEHAERRFRETRDALWHIGTPMAAVLTVHAWMWAASPRARRRYRGPAKHSRQLLVPIAVTASLLIVIGVAYRKAFWTPVHPHFDTSC
ncbi:MAG TPA: hypothetical protein VFS19_03410, partial [Planctomycetota bacterium]|nr:hypothetical protein [Planctomycetota bacterium]